MKFVDLCSGSLKKYLFISFLLFTSFSCKDDPVKPPDNVDFSISVEDVSCIEAWISLKAASASEIKLFRNDSLISLTNRTPLDTIIYDEGLLPNLAYTYKAEVLFNNKTYTKEAIVQTLDTTSHNYTWQKFEFGDYTHSYLKDIAIIDENNIWAVGAIYMNDSLGQPDPNAYNAVHWDGEKWELKRIYYYGNCSAVEYPPLRAIWPFSSDNIAVTNGGSIGWFNGDSITLDCKVNILLAGAINEIWGSSSNSMYVVGNNGSIAHYNGTSWSRIESGTDVDLNDIYGSPDGKIIWIGGNKLDKTVLLKITNNTVTEVFNGSASEIINGRYVGTIQSVWTNSVFGIYYLNAGWGEINFQRTVFDSLNPRLVADNLKFYMSRLRGIALNDVYTAGQKAIIGHFNGMRYQEYYSVNNTRYSFNGLSVRGNIVAAAGDISIDYANSKAVIVVGKK